MHNERRLQSVGNTIIFVVTLAPGGVRGVHRERIVHLDLFVWPHDLIFVYKRSTPVARSSKIIRNRIRIWTLEFIKDFSPMRDWTKYYIKIHNDIKSASWWKKCVMMSKVHHSKQGSAICDCHLINVNTAILPLMHDPWSWEEYYLSSITDIWLRDVETGWQLNHQTLDRSHE